MPLSLTIRRLLSSQPADLPVFHPIAIRLQQMLNSLDFTMDEVVKLVNEDPSLAGHILRMANSTVYMGRVRVETIKDAVVRMGALQVANITMAASQAGLHASDNELINRYLQSLWLHSHACAVGCRWLAKAAGYPHLADQVYLAGLLHDVGKLYLLKALEQLNNAGVAQTSLEEEFLLDIFTELHVEQGCRIMEYWNLPQTYIDAVAFHHADKYDTSNRVVTIVRLVNSACTSKGISLMPDPSLDVLTLPQASLLELTAEEIAELGDILDETQDLSA